MCESSLFILRWSTRVQASAASSSQRRRPTTSPLGQQQAALFIHACATLQSNISASSSWIVCCGVDNDLNHRAEVALSLSHSLTATTRVTNSRPTNSTSLILVDITASKPFKSRFAMCLVSARKLVYDILVWQLSVDCQGL